METRSNKRWKPQEIDFLRANISQPVSWLSQQLNRSQGSVTTMVWKLKMTSENPITVKNIDESIIAPQQKPIWQLQINKAKEILIAEGMKEDRADNEISYALTFFHENATLKNCTTESILTSLINIGRTGISLNPAHKLSYLTNRDGKCIFDLTYRGLSKTLTDSGSVKVIDAHIVYEGDEFDYSPADLKIYHAPKIAMTEAENNARKIRGAYSIAVLQDGTKHPHFMEAWNLEKIARLSSSNFYNEWREDMYKKCVIRSHYKFLPKRDLSNYVQSAILLDEENTGMNFHAGKNKKKIGMMDFFSNQG